MSEPPLPITTTVTITVPSTAPRDLIQRVSRFAVELGDSRRVDQVLLEIIRTCEGCGCTDQEACLGGCWWVLEEPEPGMPDLCSTCVDAS